VKSYGDAIRPATVALVQLEQQQQQVAESGKAAGEEVAQIGFRYGQAQKAIKDATDALKEVPAAAEDGAQETKGLGAGLLDAARSSNVLGGSVEVLTSAKEKYTTAVNLAKAAITAEVGVLGLLKLALAGLSQRADNEAAKLRIRAEALSKLAALEAADADAGRQRRAKELSDEAQHYNLLADGMLAGRTQAEQLQAQASEQYKDNRIAAVLDEQDARLAIVAAGSQDEANIRLETENRIKQIQADSQQAQLEQLKQQTEKVASVVAGSLSSLAALQDADSQAKLARLDAEMNREGVSAARKAVLEKQKLRVEQQAAEQRKKIARAQGAVQLGQAILQILSEPSLLPFPLAEIAKGIEIAAATATAYAQFKAIDSAKFAQGGIAYGPSHAQGGIQLHSRGRAVGIEIEGGEAIINKRSTALFGPLLSTINQMGGGRAFYKDPLEGSALMARLAVGGVVPANLPEYLPQVRTGGVVVHMPPAPPAPEIDYDRLGQAVAKYAGPAFVAGAQALLSQHVNITELRERIKKEDDFEKYISNI
jgi:hypothetical protein